MQVTSVHCLPCRCSGWGGGCLFRCVLDDRTSELDARFCSLKVEDTPAVLLKGMAGSVLPIAVAHGEGRAEFASREAAEACLKTGLVTLRYVDS